ncbi:MAG: radical SAM protein, partial [Chitinophagaceae bacterium]|nr:radical SAM protein [Chitinophagaceae bacterium]
FIGAMPNIVYFTKSKKGKEWQMASVIFSTKKETIEIKLGKVQADWIMLLLPKISIYNAVQLSMQQVKESYETETGLDDFELFWFNNPMHQVSKVGVLVI